jgi:hypothetical protein
MSKPKLECEDGIDEKAWERAMVPRRRRRTTPATQPIAPISMEQIAAEFAEAMKVDRE